MSVRTRSTIKMLTIRSGIANQEIPEKAQEVLELFEDPTVSSQAKKDAEKAVNDKIRELESRVTTRKLKDVGAGSEPPAP